MFVKLLTSVIVWVYGAYKQLFQETDYKLISRTLEYEIDWKENYEITSDFWRREESYWSPYNTKHFVDITHVDVRKDFVPANVKNPIIRIKYFYKNNVYKYITKDFEYAWPPRDNADVVFSVPITKAVLMNGEGQVMRDVTEKIRRYSGYKNNFYGYEDILIRDLFFYDDDTLQKEYPCMVVSNALNKIKVVSTSTNVKHLLP